MRELPLAGLTVVSIEQAVAAPYATRQLADLGARVIKIERPIVGDFARGYDSAVNGLASYFVWLNRSKESIALDLKDEAARLVADRLIAGADIFVENLAPGAADRLGFGAESLRRRHPALIVCKISGYGADGPWSDRKAYDLLVQAEAGLVSITGTPDAPARVGISVADISAGMFAYSGILAALFRRTRTGDGSLLDVSLLESLSEWMSQPAYFVTYGNQQLDRLGVEHATIAPYGLFSTEDGQSIVFSVQNEREWVAFCEIVLEDPSLALNPRYGNNSARVVHRPEVNSLVSARLGALSVGATASLLHRAGIAYAQVNSTAAATAHPVLEGRARWREVATEYGDVKALIPPAVPSDLEPRMDAVPALGQQTAAILAELGFTESIIAQMAERGAIGLS